MTTSDGSDVARPPLAALRDFIRDRAPLERCELCGKALVPEHPHLFHTESRQLVCGCEPCAVLFAGSGSPAYKRVPRDITRLSSFALTGEQWDALMIPIGLAFILRSSATGQMLAVYPSPVGATESLLPLDAWDRIAAGHARLLALEADVEALLVNRVDHRAEAPTARYFVVPIDECYKLVGLVRRSWRGLSGGTEVWREIAEFFAGLDERAQPEPETARA